jgi:S1-C subfamily serine protease
MLSTLESKLYDTRIDFTNEISLVNTAVEATGSSLKEYKTSTEDLLQTVEENIDENIAKLSKLDAKADITRNIIDDSVLRSKLLYDQAKEAIVIISDGQSLLGSGFVTSHSQRNSPATVHRVWTAYHVVEGLTDIYVTYHDGRTWKAGIRYCSEELDIAILGRIFPIEHVYTSEPISYTPTSLVDSGEVQPGDPVFVLGSPGDDETYRMGFKQTMTTGSISQINRCATIDGDFVTNMLQFDAPVNFGNSGSPLFNSEGHVIGLVVARINPLLGDGIGFAVTSNHLMKISESSETPDPETPIIPGVSSPSYPYPWTGITVEDISPSDIYDNNNSVTAGAKVIEVSGSARNAGVNVGDIVVGLDGMEVHNSDEFYCFITEFYNVSDTVLLEIIRYEMPMSVHVNVGVKP